MSATNQHTNYLISIPLSILIFLSFALNAGASKDITVPFQLINGLIVLEAEVEGIQGQFLLDTGADAIFLDGNPHKTDNFITTLGGDVKMASKKIKQLKIGAFIQYRVEAQITSLSVIEQQLGIDLHGIIGGSFFKPRTLIMDFSNSILTISTTPLSKKDKKTMKAFPFELSHDIPIVKVNIQGIDYKFALDSGASIHLIDDQVIKKLSNLKALPIRSNISSVGGIKTKQRYVLDKFTIGTINFSGHHCLNHDFKEINKELEQPISGLISISSLAKNKVVVDFKKNLLYL